MKSQIVAIAVLALTAIGLNAQTNIEPSTISVPMLSVTNEASAGDKDNHDYGSYELTLGGGGFTNPKTSETQFGLDVSLSTDPFEKVPCLWVGVAQNLSWEPTFAGETDLFSDYSWHIYKQLWLNTGWSVGVSYDNTGASAVLHTGPEVSFEYYIGDSSFIYWGANDDIPSRGDNGIFYKFGIGLTW